MFLLSMEKNVAMPGMAKGQIKVAKLLLQYGLRPDARGVCGKDCLPLRNGVYGYGYDATTSGFRLYPGSSVESLFWKTGGATRL